MVMDLGRMAVKMFTRPILTGTPNLPPLESAPGRETSDETIPGYADLEALRNGEMDYITWLESSYTCEMQRRQAYYDMNQVQSDAGALRQLETEYITPDNWNLAHSGPGWEDIRAMLPDATAETCVKPVATNFAQVIVDNRAVVYDEAPERREIVVGDKPDEKSTKNLGLIYDACLHDLTSKYLCRWTSLFGTAFQVISYDEEEECLVKTNVEPYRVRAIAPDGVTNIQNPEVVVSIAQDLLTLGDISRDNGNLRVWQVWWRDMWWYETVEGSTFQDIELTEPGFNMNPYKDNKGRPVKPILVVHDNPTVTKIHEPGSDILILQNQVVDRMYTGNAHTMEYQTFAVPVITGADIEEVEAQPYSAGAPQVYRNENTRFQFAHPAAPIGESVGATTKITRTFARLHKVDSELVDGESTVQSGVSRAQSRTALTERRNEEFPKWKVYERESYWLSSIVWNTFNPSEKLPVPDRKPRPGPKVIVLLVQFGEMDLAIDPLSESATITADIKNDLISRSEVIAARRRIPLERAKLIHKDIKKQNEDDKPKEEMMFGVGGPKKPGEPGMPRLGQSGNRPTNLDERDKSKVGGNTTSATGNVSIGKK